FSVSMPLVAISPSFTWFVMAYALVRFSLNGEWAIGSMLVAETWPARLRGLVISCDRSTWGVGAALAGRPAVFRVDRDLCADDVSGIAVLGAHHGSQEPLAGTHRGRPAP